MGTWGLGDWEILVLSFSKSSCLPVFLDTTKIGPGAYLSLLHGIGACMIFLYFV